MGAKKMKTRALEPKDPLFEALAFFCSNSHVWFDLSFLFELVSRCRVWHRQANKSVQRCSKYSMVREKKKRVCSLFQIPELLVCT